MRDQYIETIAALCYALRSGLHPHIWTYSALCSRMLKDELQSVEVVMASVMDISFLELIITTYRFAQKNYPDMKSLGHIWKVGDKLQDGTYTMVVMSMSVHIREGGTILPTNSNEGNHWTTLFIDAKKSSILYGDSFKLPPPA